MKNNKRWVIYCRVSTDKQQKEWDSLDRQERACREYCRNNAINVVWVFKEAFSWKRTDRVIFNEAISNAIENKANYFVIFDIDRFSREWYEKHSELKRKLAFWWVTLRDSKNVICDERIVINNDLIDISWYGWNRENPSEITEMVLSTNAKMEWKKILQRTIPKEIALEQMGYHVRESNFWFKNKRVCIFEWKWTIQIRDIIEWPFIEEIFNLRAKNIDDVEIVDRLNLIGYKSRGDWLLTVKQMQIYIKNPIYAWVICSKWTWNMAVRTAYKALVSITVWNNANKWKRTILESLNWDIKLIYWKQGEDKLEIQRRSKFNVNLPFRNLIKSSLLNDQYISWSFSTNNKWNVFWYYHPIRKKWSLGENIRKEEFERTVYDLLGKFKINWILRELFLDRFEIIFSENIKQVEVYRNWLNSNLKWIINEITDLEGKIVSVDITLTRILQKIENRLKTLEDQKEEIELKIRECNNWNFEKLDTFKEFCFNILEHLDVLAMQSQSFEELEVIFKFIFRETPTYNDIINRTPNTYPIFYLQSQQKNPPEGEFSVNIDWQPQ